MIWLRYVPHAKVSAYTALGWQPTDGLSTTHHGVHAIIMEWQGEGVPPQC